MHIELWVWIQAFQMVMNSIIKSTSHWFHTLWIIFWWMTKWWLFCILFNRHSLTSCYMCVSKIVILKWLWYNIHKSFWLTILFRLKEYIIMEKPEYMEMLYTELNIHKNNNKNIVLNKLVFSPINPVTILKTWNNRVTVFDIWFKGWQILCWAWDLFSDIPTSSFWSIKWGNLNGWSLIYGDKFCRYHGNDDSWLSEFVRQINWTGNTTQIFLSGFFFPFALERSVGIKG